jgi:UTP--glucose-1-phosphate uridylyltransferase
MLPVGRKPAVQYVVEELQEAGLDQVLFVTGRKKSAIENHFDSDPELARVLVSGGGYALLDELKYLEAGTRFFYIRQSIPKGLADAIHLAEDFVGGEHFVAGLGDSIIKSSDGNCFLSDMIACHQAHGADCTIAVEQVSPEDVHRYGIVSPGKPEGAESDWELEDLVEKPSREAAPSNWAIAAHYVFSPDIFEAITRTYPDSSGELQITDSIRLLIRMGKKVRAMALKEGQRRYDIGNFESYFKAFIDFAVSDEKYGYLIRQYLKRKSSEL